VSVVGFRRRETSGRSGPERIRGVIIHEDIHNEFVDRIAVTQSRSRSEQATAALT
jgi:hypothetical protein